jgi:hypothetical protein
VLSDRYLRTLAAEACAAAPHGSTDPLVLLAALGAQVYLARALGGCSALSTRQAVYYLHDDDDEVRRWHMLLGLAQLLLLRAGPGHSDRDVVRLAAHLDGAPSLGTGDRGRLAQVSSNIWRT